MLAPLIYRIARQYSGWLLALLPLGLFVFFASHLNTIAHGEALHESLTWVPSLNVNLSFMLDGLSLMMALIVTGIGTLIIIYAGGYLARRPAPGSHVRLPAGVHGRHAGSGAGG